MDKEERKQESLRKKEILDGKGKDRREKEDRKNIGKKKEIQIQLRKMRVKFKKDGKDVKRNKKERRESKKSIRKNKKKLKITKEKK